VVINPPDGDLGVYLDSLAKVRDARPGITPLAPGHGRLMVRVTEVIDGLIAHRLARHTRVAEALREAGTATVEALLPGVYADVTEAQLPVARRSLWAHLRFLAQQDRAEAVDVTDSPDQEETIETRWRWLAADPRSPA
jgi:glyoxylase-like metal-dependent hydrolase (beta-lactamase superfamily II)